MAITSSRFRFRAPLLVAALCALARAEPLLSDPETDAPARSAAAEAEAPERSARDLASRSPSPFERDAALLRDRARAAAAAVAAPDRARPLAAFSDYVALALRRPGAAPATPGELFARLAAAALEADALPAVERAPRVAALAEALADAAERAPVIDALARRDAAAGLVAAANARGAPGAGMDGLSMRLFELAVRVDPAFEDAYATYLGHFLPKILPQKDDETWRAAIAAVPVPTPALRFGFPIVEATAHSLCGNFDAATNAVGLAGRVWNAQFPGAPPPPAWFAALSEALLHGGRTNAALRALEDGLVFSPDPSLRNNLAYLLADAGGDLERALALADEALAARPLEPAFLDTLGWILFKRGQPADALAAFHKALELSDEDEDDPEMAAHIQAAVDALKSND